LVSFLYNEPFTTVELGNWEDGPIMLSRVTTSKYGKLDDDPEWGTFISSDLADYNRRTTPDDRFYLLWGAEHNDGGIISWLADDSNNGGNEVPDPDQDVSADVYLFGEERAARLKKGVDISYWLRSPYWNEEDISTSDGMGNDITISDDYRVLVVNEGIGNEGGDIGVPNPDSKMQFLGVRPVFRFNPKFVIFMSEISGDPKMGGTQALGGYAVHSHNGEHEVEEDGIVHHEDNRYQIIKNYKLTILNEKLSAGNVTVSGEPLKGRQDPNNPLVISVGKSNEVLVSSDGVDPWTSLTYKIVSGDEGSREIVGYGQRIPTSLSGINSILIDTDDLYEGKYYTVYVWTQQYKEKNSHEGSGPEYFTLHVLPSPSKSPNDDDGGVASDGGGGGCEAGFGILTFLTALVGFAVKRRR
jgi:hypothetical protein